MNLEPEQIVTNGDFVAFLHQLADSSVDYAGSLEEYLRSVLRVVLAHAGDEASTQLIARILADAFSTPPLAFDPAWFAYTGPPDVLATDQWDEAHNYEAALDMLRYQIADLRRMADAGTLGGPNRWFGITSPTGYTWYNIEPQAFLECQTGGMVVDENVHESDWGELVIILWLGEIYE